MSMIHLDHDLLRTMETPFEHGDGATLVLPPGYDTDDAVNLLIRDGVGSREVDLLLSERRMNEIPRLVQAMSAEAYLTHDAYTGEPERELPSEALLLKQELAELETFRKATETEVATLRGPAGRERARAALARYRLVPYEQRDEAVRAAGDRPIFLLTRASYGLCETMADRLEVRGLSLGLPEGHEETVLREGEREKWGGPSPDAAEQD